MKILGITGSIASGKSYALKCFDSFPKVLTYSSDAEVHKLFANDKQLFLEVKEFFPAAIIDRKINRKILGDIVFKDHSQKEILESLIYPKLFLQRQRLIREATIRKDLLIVFEIPLLFENHIDLECDYVLTVHCSPIIQKLRALRRKNINKEKLSNIISSQLPFNEKIKLSDFSINSGEGKSETFRDCEFIYRLLISM